MLKKIFSNLLTCFQYSFALGVAVFFAWPLHTWLSYTSVMQGYIVTVYPLSVEDGCLYVEPGYDTSRLCVLVVLPDLDDVMVQTHIVLVEPKLLLHHLRF